MKVWLPVIRGNSGTDVYSVRLVKALSRRGIAATITWFPSLYQFAPFLLRHVSPPSGIQMVHANSWNGFAFRRPGLPIVVTRHLDVLDPGYFPYKTRAQDLFHRTLIHYFERASFQAASAITAVSESTARSVNKLCPPAQAHLIYNWIDTELFTVNSGNRRYPHDPFRLLFVGNLSRRKGGDLFEPIMERLGPAFQLHFTSGRHRSKSARRCNNMIPLGRLTEEYLLLNAYHACDALLFPSRLEGCSLVVLEAMACGKPVVAAAVSSLAELVENHVSGILCPPDDIEAFAEACRELARDSENVHTLGKAARLRVEERFSEERIIPQYVELYQKVLDGERR